MELWSDNGDCAAAVSLTLQFLFQELKYAPAPLAWLHRKLHQEIIDLLTRTTSGKLFESLAVYILCVFYYTFFLVESFKVIYKLI